ncbi:hypothetical protein [Nocardia transvalensis]|uniref:hypothetical protein n=1 Tax=Nocardia transvalensis TaxID=37333 RepID=UPI0018935C5B|nr:hypothetical protein [Nocardia transvalensis]MBF6331736.1 hypothetical protein [Nocardia transvalensis]
MLISSEITMVEAPDDRTIVIDPAIRYRPERIKGRRYHITTSAPRSGNGLRRS